MNLVDIEVYSMLSYTHPCFLLDLELRSVQSKVALFVIGTLCRPLHKSLLELHFLRL